MPDARPHIGQRDVLFSEIIHQNNRADPYPLYARLRENPVSRQSDGSYVVSSHAAIRSLIFDPRLSSEDLPPSRRPHTGHPLRDWIINPIKNRIVTAHRPLIFRDPPDHDTLRRFVMRQFMVGRVNALRERIEREVDRLIDACRGRDWICLVDDFSYPLPVTVICELLGVPEADEPRFQAWATQLATAIEPDARHDEAARHRTVAAFDEISAYMRDLIRERRRRPADDMLSGLAAPASAGGKRMGDFDLIATAVLLLVAGHERTPCVTPGGSGSSWSRCGGSPASRATARSSGPLTGARWRPSRPRRCRWPGPRLSTDRSRADRRTAPGR